VEIGLELRPVPVGGDPGTAADNAEMEALMGLVGRWRQGRDGGGDWWNDYDRTGISC
jgi:hypothetical protein